MHCSHFGNYVIYYIGINYPKMKCDAFNRRKMVAKDEERGRVLFQPKR